MNSPVEILKQYWGYDSFRPLQEDIIQSVLAGNDTLALLPTGGGKSICFQVPAMCLEGLCLVISPLIALMKDQVEHLREKEIAAYAIYSGMSKKEIDVILDNCIYGKVKFLYLSPERLKTDLFINRLAKMNIGLLAIDEAHCISQWGYDFRPPYLEIKEFREHIPDVATIALTATATAKVKLDIADKLGFVEPKIFQKSFSRENLSYSIRKVEDKFKKAAEVLNKVKGTAIIYARTRKETTRIADWLKDKRINADFYHAGLSGIEREEKQNQWMKGQIRVMVATNAFGMGIDKSDVRLVVHMDLPDTLEAYYQEAGRAGRDEKKAYAVIIYEPQDIEQLRKRIDQRHPKIDFLRKVYQSLANYLQVAAGSSNFTAFEFDISDFSQQYNLNPLEVFNALDILQGQGLIQLTESFYNPSKIFFTIDNQELYKFQVSNSHYDKFIKGILRIYGGEVFSSYTIISESRLANYLEISEQECGKSLHQLKKRGIMDYIPQSDKPRISFLEQRFDASKLPVDKARIRKREQVAREKMEAVINYATHTVRCRTQLLLEYFDEVSYQECGVCDLCVEKKRARTSGNFVEIRKSIINILTDNTLTMEELVKSLKDHPEKETIKVIRQLLDNKEISLQANGKLSV